MVRLAASLAIMLPLVAAADPPKGWPAAGRCIFALKGCVQIGPDDTKAIQRAIVDYLDDTILRNRPDYRPAKVIAARPITESTIGGFILFGGEFVGFKGEVVVATVVEGHEHEAEQGFNITLGRKSGRWSVLHLDHYDRSPPTLR